MHAVDDRIHTVFGRIFHLCLFQRAEEVNNIDGQSVTNPTPVLSRRSLCRQRASTSWRDTSHQYYYKRRRSFHFPARSGTQQRWDRCRLWHIVDGDTEAGNDREVGTSWQRRATVPLSFTAMNNTSIILYTTTFIPDNLWHMTYFLFCVVFSPDGD